MYTRHKHKACIWWTCTKHEPQCCKEVHYTGITLFCNLPPTVRRPNHSKEALCQHLQSICYLTPSLYKIYSQWKFFNGYIKLAVFCTTVKRLLCVYFCTVFETNSCVLSSTPLAKSCEEYMEWNKFCSIVHYLVHPSQRMLHPSIRKTKQWMLYRETKAGYSENHVIHIYTLCRQYAEFLVWNLAVCIQTTKLSKG